MSEKSGDWILSGGMTVPEYTWASGGYVNRDTTWTTTTTTPVVSPAVVKKAFAARGPLPATRMTIEPLPPGTDMEKPLELPTKSPRKLVIAFLDEDENVEWCGMVRPDSVDIHAEKGSVAEMQIAFKLIDANKEAE